MELFDTIGNFLIVLFDVCEDFFTQMNSNV